jgi:hypothetical protein
MEIGAVTPDIISRDGMSLNQDAKYAKSPIFKGNAVHSRQIWGKWRNAFRSRDPGQMLILYGVPQGILSKNSFFSYRYPAGVKLKGLKKDFSIYIQY